MMTTKRTARLMSMLAMLCLALCLTTACSEKNDGDEPDTPVTPVTPDTPTNPDDWQTVPASGGTVSRGDLSITFPSGTFAAETKVAVTEVTKGSVRGEDEVSTFYQVTMPAKVNKSAKVSIKSDKTEGKIVIMAHMLGRSLDGESLDYSDYPLETTCQNGTYTADFAPESNNEEANATGTVTFGLAYVAEASSQSNARGADTRSDSDGNFRFTFDWGWTTSVYANLDLQNEMLGYFNEAVSIIKGLGFKVEGDRKVPIVIVKEKSEGGPLNQDEFGRYEMSFWGKKYGRILMNDGFRSPKNGNFTKETLRKTCIHELLHYFQADYDPRTAWFKGGVANKNGTSLVLMESGGVWAEQFMADGGAFSTIFIAEPARAPQVMRGLTTIVGGSAGYQPHGYGTSIFLEYMSKTRGKDKIVKLYERWHKDYDWSVMNMDDVLKLYKDWAKDIGSDVFSLTGFDDFILGVSTFGVVDNFSVNTILSGPEYVNDKKTISKEETITYNGEINPYGGRYVNFQIYGYNGTMKGKSLTFAESKGGVMTYAYLYSQKEFTPLGFFTSTDTLVITDETVLEQIRTDTKNNKVVYLITVNNLNDRVQTSEVSVTFGEQDHIDLTPDQLSFEATTGTKTVTVDTNFDELDLTPSDESWISASFDKAAEQITVSVKANTGAKREGTVTVKGGDIVETIKVTQAASTGNCWQLVSTDVDDSGAHRENSWISDVTGGGGSYSYTSTWMDGPRQYTGLDHDTCDGEAIHSTLTHDPLKDSYKANEVISLNISWTYTDYAKHPFKAGPMKITFQYVYSTGSYGYFRDDKGYDDCPDINSIDGTGEASNGGYPSSGSGFLASPPLKTGSKGEKLEIRMWLGNIWPSYKVVYVYEWVP